MKQPSVAAGITAKQCSMLWLQRLLLVFVALSGSSCATTPPDPWFDSFKTVPRNHPLDFPAQAERYLELSRQAHTDDDRCAAWEQAARALDRAPDGNGQRLWNQIEQSTECGQLRARALYEQSRLAMENNRFLIARARLERLVVRWPTSYWARRGTELVHMEARKLAKAGEMPAEWLLEWYRRNPPTILSGHLLYYASRILHEESPETNEASFYLLMLLFDHHTDSPLWTSGAWMAFDLLKEMGREGDESRLLEEALLPNDHRGTDTLTGPFAEKVRLRLARLYERQGRYEEAERALVWVINYHHTVSLKDDALWMLARVYRSQGRPADRTSALRFLVHHCPWSRHLEEAQRILDGR